MANKILDADAINFSYSGKKTILSDVNLSISEGNTIAIQGPSGVGKTTLLEILGAMRTPNSGSVRIDGISIYEQSIAERSTIRGQKIGFVFQEGLLLPDLTVWENCRLAVELTQSNPTTKQIRARFESLMNKVDLDPGRKSDIPAQLSSGERQRLALVRALMHEPVILMADEPTGNLDPETSEKLIELMIPLARSHKTSILVATHDRTLAQSFEDIYMLEAGRLSPEASEKT